MQIQKIIYWILKWILKVMLFLVLLAGTIASAVFAVITVIPDPFASKACRLGYKAHCAFAVSSTVPANFFSYTLPRSLHDIFAFYGLIFWIWQVVDAYILAKKS